MSIAEMEIEKFEKGGCDENKVFYQAMEEVIRSIAPLLESDPKYAKYAVLERLVVPDRVIKFKVTWFDDNQNVMVNTGYRIQFNNSLGPYKGGLRFHPSVNEGILKFLGFEQILKNSLTGLPIGGAKGEAILTLKEKATLKL
jgi:glutamate dehydrogenase (NADP+)